MPNRKVHAAVGVMSSVGVAAVTLNGQELSPWQAGLELIADGVAGHITSALPDRIDRPMSPSHRAAAHSMTAGVAVGVYALSHVPSFQTICRTKAREFERMRMTSQDLVQTAILFLAEAGLYVASGIAVGAPVGYASHLALDMTTPSGLPLA